MRGGDNFESVGEQVAGRPDVGSHEARKTQAEVDVGGWGLDVTVTVKRWFGKSPEGQIKKLGRTRRMWREGISFRSKRITSSVYMVL